MQFHMTYDNRGSRLLKPYIEDRNIPVMINASQRYSDSSGFLDCWSYDTPYVIDSGGYNVMSNYGGYPWSIKEYHKFLEEANFNWSAVMDYACEEKFDDIMTVEERMEKTVENTIKHFDLEPNYNLLPVLQGRTINQYLESYDMLKDHGIDISRVGLGTVCRISSSEEIIETENRIREETDIDWIHGFGVKINAYKMGATFESADSFAWVRPVSYGKMFVEGGDKLIEVRVTNDSTVNRLNSFKNYYDYVKSIDRDDRFKCKDCEFSTNDKDSLVEHCTSKQHRLTS